MFTDNTPTHNTQRADKRIISSAQIRYCEILFSDCGFNSLQRKDWLLTGYNVRNLDELTMIQGGQIIRYLLGLREQQKFDRGRNL